MKTISRLFLKLTCLLGLASCAGHTALPGVRHREQDERIRRKREPAVLFVGNSYSFGVPAAFKQVAAEHGITVRTGHATYGGWSLAKHAENAATLRKIRSGGWDVVVFQEYSLTPALPPRRRAKEMFPPLRTLVAAAREAGAVPLLYQTWGRRDGDPQIAGDDFHAMNARVRDGYRAASAEMDGIVIVPAGDDWEREFSAGRGRSLFQEDGSHPSAAGNRVTAETFYRTLFGPETKKEGARPSF